MGSLGPSIVSQQSKGAATKPAAAVGHEQQQQQEDRCGFQMPLHYPRYKKADYEAMPEWRVDCLLREYGLPPAAAGDDVHSKRRFAMGAFLWPDQY
ncbi:hypothetical protein BRADI_3g09710v3 [Brachypodium distachyon]|uniref:DUF7722 domain-containing protein n=2 Tax=Brachypodium distachyon TaxID=15368 RepID=I1HZC0_BRADI|nr:hypothetical protein BRADI_3g09710v3 [Brachypodium distachyon]